MLAEGIQPTVLAVEFDEINFPIDGDAYSRIKTAVEVLVDVGYTIVSVDGPNYTFVSGSMASG